MPDEIRTPECPRCGRPPIMATAVTQAFCGNPTCKVFTWSMLDDAATFEATAVEIDLPDE